MLRPSLLLSGSALLGVLSLFLMGSEWSWLARRQGSLAQLPLQVGAASFGLFEDEPDPTPLLIHQAQLQEQVEQLEQRSRLHQQQAHQILADRVDRQGIPHRTPIAARSSPAPTLPARPRRQDPTLSHVASTLVARNSLARLTEQIAQEPGNAQLYLQRAQHFWSQSQEDPFALPQLERASAIAQLLQAALRDLNIAIVLDPYLKEAYLLKSKIEYERLQKPDLALATLSPLDRFAYRDPQLHLLRSRIWAEQGHLESAFDVAHLAIELAQQNQNKADLFEAYVHRGLMWGNICELSLAIQDFGRAIELLPDRAEPYYYRGIAAAYAGSDLQQAAADLGRALVLWRASGTGSPARLEHAEAIRMQLWQQLHH